MKITNNPKYTNIIPDSFQLSTPVLVFFDGYFNKIFKICDLIHNIIYDKYFDNDISIFFNYESFISSAIAYHIIDHLFENNKLLIKINKNNNNNNIFINFFDINPKFDTFIISFKDAISNFNNCLYFVNNDINTVNNNIISNQINSIFDNLSYIIQYKSSKIFDYKYSLLVDSSKIFDFINKNKKMLIIKNSVIIPISKNINLINNLFAEQKIINLTLI